MSEPYSDGGVRLLGVGLHRRSGGPKGIDWDAFPLGIESDPVIARMAGVTARAVLCARERRGIQKVSLSMAFAKFKRSPADRLLEKMVVVDSGCWIWVGAVSSKGYGKIYLDGKWLGAHRLSYELFVGPIPKGLTIDHLCRNTGCINWRHMEPVTLRVNVLRGTSPWAKNARKINCPKCGGEYSFEGESRRCAPCRMSRVAARRAP